MKLLPFGTLNHGATVYSITFSPTGLIASAGLNGAVNVWEAATGKHLHRLGNHESASVWVSFADRGATLLSTDYNSVRLWDSATGGLQHRIVCHESWVYCAEMWTDDRTLVTTGNDGYLRIWDTTTQVRIYQSRIMRMFSESAVFSRDGRLAYADCGSVRICRFPSMEPILSLRSHRSTVKSVRFSPNLTTIASGSYDKSIKVWNAATGAELGRLSGHKDRVWCIDFSPDGQWLASAGWDGEVIVWDCRTLSEVSRTEHHGSSVNAVCFSHDGLFLASGDKSGMIRIWSVEDERVPLADKPRPRKRTKTKTQNQSGGIAPHSK